MPIDIDSAFGIHAQAMALRSRRAEVLASNLANADTPNYKARDIDFKAVLAQAQAGGSSTVTVAATQPGHIGAATGSIAEPEMSYRVPRQPSIDGNTVDTETEHAEFARNALEYQASLRFLSGRIRTLLTAIRGD